MRRARTMVRGWVRWLAGDARRRLGSRPVRRLPAPEGAAGEPRANAAAEAGLAPAARSRGYPALAAGEPMARPTLVALSGGRVGWFQQLARLADLGCLRTSSFQFPRSLKHANMSS